MSGLGAFGAAPKLSAENEGGIVGAFKGNPLVELITALGQFPEMQRKAEQERLAIQQQKIQNEYLPQQIQAQTQEQQAYAQQVKLQSDNALRAQATQRWQQLGQMALANPQWAQSPTFKQSVLETSQQMGIPAPLNPDGSVNTDVWKANWGQAITKDKTLVAEAMSRPAGPARDAFLASFSGVPDEVRFGAQSLNPKDQAEIMRAQAYMASAGSMGRYRDAMTNAISKRLQIQKDLAQSKEGVDAARIIQLQASAHKADVDAQTAMARVELAGRNADLRSQELELKIQQFNQRATMDGQKLVQGAAKSAIAEGHNLDSAINTIQQQIINATSNNAPDTTLKALNDRLFDLTHRRDKIMNTIHNANEILKENLGGNAAIEGTVKAQSGARKVTVSNPTSALPKTRVVGGTTYYLHSDGKYYTKP